MHKTQLFTGALVLILTVAGCNRTETSREARETAADVKAAASRAGEKLADSWLTTKVQAQYFADEDIKSRYINVTSRDGIVTVKVVKGGLDVPDEEVGDIAVIASAAVVVSLDIP